MVGRPVAVKGTGRGLTAGHEDREDLLKQYLLMRQLQVDSETCLTPSQKDLFTFCPVYAAIRAPVQRIEGNQEWLLMARVVNGEWTKDRGYFAEYGPAVAQEGIDPDTDYELMRAFNLYNFNATWKEFGKRLRKQGLYVKDLAGRNVLRSIDEKGKKHYTIIDQKAE